MSKVEKILQEHVSNFDTLLGPLKDLAYSFVLPGFLGEMEIVLNEEKEGLRFLDQDDKEAIAAAEFEITKLELLILKLTEAKIPSDEEIRKAIRERYMR